MNPAQIVGTPFRKLIALHPNRGRFAVCAMSESPSAIHVESSIDVEGIPARGSFAAISLLARKNSDVLEDSG
jgi:hypothetical protein